MPLAGFQDVLDIYPRFEINSDGFICVDLDGMNLKGKERRSAYSFGKHGCSP